MAAMGRRDASDPARTTREKRYMHTGANGQNPVCQSGLRVATDDALRISTELDKLNKLTHGSELY